ncbi:MAG: cytochrome c biogenesis protein ResB [Syntrophorhabdaceae bacterium]|nr:cytochrome c biogenesis protein ResB [Syntrophorhabdaceae bacterium]
MRKSPEATKADASPAPADRLWSLLTSVKLAVFTLIALAAASILGTLVEQNLPLEKYREIYEDWAFAIMDRVNLFDMYHSRWFLALLALFTVNLVCCTIDRFPKMLKVVRNPRAKLDDGFAESLPLMGRWVVKNSDPSVASRYADAMTSLFAKPLVTHEGDDVHMYAEAGVSSRFGVYVTHLSIVVIFLGAIIGNAAGFKGYVNIPEMESVSSVAIRGGSRMRELGFSIRCNSFTVETYPTRQPKAYISDLSVLEGEQEVFRKKNVIVNDPLRYKGIWFYQASYGEVRGVVARIETRVAESSSSETLVLPPNHSVALPGYGFIRVVDYIEDFEGKYPALQVVFEKNGKLASSYWLPEGRPVSIEAEGSSRQFSFAGIAPRMYTGLQVAKDPGVNVVWVGCVLMVLGIMMAFFMSHRRVWLRLSRRADGRLEAILAGDANRNRLAFEKAFEKIRTGVKEAGK